MGAQNWGVCLEYDVHEQFRRAWSYIVQECAVPNAWERNTHEQAKFNWPGWHYVSDLNDVPGPLVIVSPKDGVHVQGKTSLYDFVHPENAVYYFGSDHADLRPHDLGDRMHSSSVFIPDSGYMHSFTAAAMVIYDRKMKQCR